MTSTITAPPVVDDARMKRLEDWVVEYALSVRDQWVANGEDVTTDDARDALKCVVLSMYVPERPEWMPIVRAQLTLAGIALTSQLPADHAWRDPEESLNLRDALRTIKSATEAELAEGVASRLGISTQQARNVMGGGSCDDPDAPTALYRHYDDAGALLYVGIATDPHERARQHERTSTWHHLSAEMTTEWFPSRAAAHKAERTAIADERPAFNIAHTGSRAQTLAVDYLMARLKAGRPASPPEPDARAS